MVSFDKGAVIGLHSGGSSLLGESFVGDGGVSGTGGGGTSGGNMVGDEGVSLFMVTSLAISRGFVSSWENRLLVFCASCSLKEVAICLIELLKSSMVSFNHP